jgi:hypothetical protein
MNTREVASNRRDGFQGKAETWSAAAAPSQQDTDANINLS